MTDFDDAERLMKALKATASLPDGWHVEVMLDNEGTRVWLLDGIGNQIDNDLIYDHLAELPEQLENAIAYAKANADENEGE